MDQLEFSCNTEIVELLELVEMEVARVMNFLHLGGMLHFEAF